LARPRLGDLLVEAGVVSRAKVERASARQREMPGNPKLGEVLLELRYVNEDAILRVLTRALHLEAADLENSEPTGEALAILDRGEAEKNLMLPLRVDVTGSRKRLVVALADPTNVEAIDNLQFKTGMVVKPMIATISQVRRALRRHYHWRGDNGGISVPHESELETHDHVETEVDAGSGSPGRPRRATAPGDIVQLEFRAGPLQGETRRLGPGVALTVGRAAEADLSIADPRMSRKHFLLVTRDNGVDLVDMGSTNGTKVNRRRVERVGLASGDLVQAGDTIIRVELLV
jgi:type IV pilus assembly protein PilB